MYYYATPPITDEIYHYGIKGMKWGIRRFRNYDGSYTRKGMERYRQSEKDYDDINKIYRESKGKKSKEELNRIKLARREAKRQMSLDYSQLKRDKLADKGKKLYQNGKTITGAADRLATSGAVASGSLIAARYLMNSGRKDLAKKILPAGLALSAGNAIWGAKNEIDARKLRAYYSHSRPNRVYDPMKTLKKKR